MVTARTMYDAIGANASVLVPKNPQMVAIYLTGGPAIQWTSSEVAMFPATTTFVRIDQGGSGAPNSKATVKDIEPGAYRPADIPNFQFDPAVERPTCYCDRSDLPAVMALWKGDIWLAAPGLSETECLAIAANNPQIVAVQNVFAQSYDASVVIDPYWPRKAPVTTPTHPVATAPPGVWKDAAVLTGIGTDGLLYTTTYSVATGLWSVPAKVG